MNIMASKNRPLAKSALNMKLVSQCKNEDTTGSKLGEYDSCINCNINLVQESSKVSKIFRLVYTDPAPASNSRPLSPVTTPTGPTTSQNGDDDKNTMLEVSLVKAISVTLNCQDVLEDVTFEKYFVCERCGKLLQLAFNAIKDFIELTKLGSVLQNKLRGVRDLITDCSSSVSLTNRRQKEKGNRVMTRSRSNRNNLATVKRNRRLIRTPKKKGKVKKISDLPDNKTGLEISDKVSINCNLCGKPFASEALLKKHKRFFHRNRATNGDEDELKSEEITSENCPDFATDIDQSLYYCSICELEFEKVDNFQSHLKLHEDLEEGENDSIHSYEAGAQAEDNDLADCDMSLEKFKCKLCGEDKSSVEDLKEHCSKHHPLVSILTVNDMHNVESESGENIKKKEPNGDDGKLGNGKDNGKNSPQKTTAPNGSRLIFSCNVCSKRFIRHDHIKLHLRIHTGEKPFICNVEGCGKTFSDPRGLAYHEVTHSNDRPYCCKFCGITFKRLHHLNDHERNHYDMPRRFTCESCNKAFKHRKHLNSHMVIHQGTKEHQCNLCFKAFNRKDNLRQHVKKVHGKDSADIPNNNGNQSVFQDDKEIRKSGKNILKLTEGQDEIPTEATSALVFQTPSLSGAISTRTVIATGTGNGLSVEGNNKINFSKTVPTSSTTPVTVTTDQATIDQIVYMHL